MLPVQSSPSSPGSASAPGAAPVSVGRGGAGLGCASVGGWGGEHGAVSGRSLPWAGGKRGRAPCGTASARGWGMPGSRLEFCGRAAGAGPGPQLGQGLCGAGCCSCGWQLLLPLGAGGPGWGQEQYAGAGHLGAARGAVQSCPASLLNHCDLRVRFPTVRSSGMESGCSWLLLRAWT